MQTINDQQLLADYLDASDEAAFRILVERYSGLVLGVASRKLGRHSLAEEVAQDVFVILSRKAKALRRQPEKLPGWLHRTTVWECHNLSRRERRRKSKMEDYQSHQSAMSEESEASPELCEFLDEAIDTLPESDRLAVFHRFFIGHSYKEMGEVLGKREDACQKQLSRALSKLERFFERRGLSVSSVALATLLSGELAKAAPPGIAQTFMTNALGGTYTITKTQLAMHIYHSIIKSKAFLTMGAVSAVVGLGWVAVSQADQPRQEAKAKSEGMTRLILPPGADRSDPETAALIQSVDQVAGDGDGGATGVPSDRARRAPEPKSIMMEPDEVQSQREALLHLMTMIALYANAHGEAFPDSLGQLAQLGIEDWEKYTKFEHDDMDLPLSYLSGLESESLAANRPESLRTPIVHLPVLVNGRRFVGYWDGSAKLENEAVFQDQLATALEAYPTVKIQGTPVPKQIRN